MKVMTYFNIQELITLIPNPNQQIFCKVLEYFPFFYTAPGSKHKHHNWEGGYIDHVTECMNIALTMYESLNTFRKLPFKLEDSLIVLFLHDIEKPFLYRNMISFKDRSERSTYRDNFIYVHNIELTEEQSTALKYVEGEGDDYNPKLRVMNELGAFCHSCDILSARLWYNFPQQLDLNYDKH